jgi:hypothetical protein
MDSDKLMTQILIGLGAAVAVALAFGAWKSSSGDQAAAWSGARIDWGKPARYGCDTGWMADVLPRPHPVYRQWIPGANRDGLARYGWAWISSPPGEMGLTDE